MLANYHTHTSFCDGKNTPEQMVLSAIDGGLFAIGFSGHAYTDFDLSYCMKDTDGYIREIKRLKEKYKGKIEIYLGTEEDAHQPVARRQDYDYILGSSHYAHLGGVYYAIDSGLEYFEKCMSAYGGNALALAEDYFGFFCDYVNKRKPDIIGHFDLITKFEDVTESRFFNNPEYLRMAKKYTESALKSGCIFEVNTGAISRGYRSTPYPHEELLYLIRKADGRVMLNSDSHRTDTLTAGFDDAKAMLKDIGFKSTYVIKSGVFTKIPI